MLLAVLANIHFQAERSDIDGFRTTAGSYATSALLHQTHMHTELGEKRHTLGDTAALPDFGGQGFGL